MRVSLRWRLIFVSWSLAFTIALVLSALLHTLSERQLLGELERKLETKCDEVVTVLESTYPHLALEDFLVIETRYRFTTATYYYQIRDGHDRNLARSQNLGGAEPPAARRVGKRALRELRPNRDQAGSDSGGRADPGPDRAHRDCDGRRGAGDGRDPNRGLPRCDAGGPA